MHTISNTPKKLRIDCAITIGSGTGEFHKPCNLAFAHYIGLPELAESRGGFFVFWLFSQNERF